MKDSKSKSSEEPLLDRARQLAQEHDQLSTSLLQHELRIDYQTAAKIMGQLEMERGRIAYPYPKGEPILPPAVMKILKSIVFWVLFIGLVLLLVVASSWGWFWAIIALAIYGFGIFQLLSLRESSRVVVCGNCGARMTYKRFQENDGCIECGSDVYEKTKDHLRSS